MPFDASADDNDDKTSPCWDIFQQSEDKLTAACKLCKPPSTVFVCEISLTFT